MGKCYRFHESFTLAIDNFYYRLAYWVAQHTKATLAIGFVFVILCCAGFVSFTVETDGSDLWVPGDSLAKQDERVVLRHFEEDLDFATAVFESPSGPDGSLLTKAAFDSVWEIDDAIRSLEIDSEEKFEDLCPEGPDGDCEPQTRSVTRFWVDRQDYLDTVSSDEDVVQAVNAERFPDGQPVTLEAIFGTSITYDDEGRVEAASALSLSYTIVTSTNEGETKENALAWLQEFIDYISESEESYSDTFTIAYLAGRSYDDALAESVTGEIFIFVITYTLMIIFVMIVVGRCCAGSVRRRTWLGGTGVGSVVAAGLAAYGINSAFEVPFTSLSQVLPFILVGIGVDDMFVIVSSFDHVDPGLPVEERVALAMKRCGVSITYTSLTNFLAFMLGSLTSLPAVEYFCLYAGTAILFDFILQVTVFVALLTMDANRQKAGRMDWCCCCTSKKFLEEEQVQRPAVIAEKETGDGAAAKVADEKLHELSSIGRWMRDTYTPFILSPLGKALVLLATGSILAAGIYGATEVTQGFSILDLTPDDHYSRDYDTLASIYKLNIDNEYLPLGIYTLEVDYPDPDVQVEIQKTDELMLDQEFVVGPIDSWLVSFLQWAGSNDSYSANVAATGDYFAYGDRDTFYTALVAFMKEDIGQRFESHIVFTEDETIEISRTWLSLIDQTTTDKNIAALEDAREVTDDSGLEPKPFPFSAVFIFTEQFVIIYDELIWNFSLALVAVIILSFVMLGPSAVVILVCLTVVIVDIDLLGFVYHWGLEVNSITVIELVMAVGLVVDYMVHIVHYFLHQDMSLAKDKRIANALGEIGPSVMLGASTTFLGIVPMIFANNFIFRVFFKMFIIIIGFGFFHGVVFVPVALSFIPDTCLMSRPAPETSAQASDVKDASAVVKAIA